MIGRKAAIGHIQPHSRVAAPPARSRGPLRPGPGRGHSGRVAALHAPALVRAAHAHVVGRLVWALPRTCRSAESATLGRYPGVAACQSGRGIDSLGLVGTPSTRSGQRPKPSGARGSDCNLHQLFGIWRSGFDSGCVHRQWNRHLPGCGHGNRNLVAAASRAQRLRVFGVPGVLHCGAQCPGCAARLALKHAHTGHFHAADGSTRRDGDVAPVCDQDPAAA